MTTSLNSSKQHNQKKLSRKEIFRNRALVLWVAWTIILSPLAAGIVSKTSANVENILSNTIIKESFKPKQLLEYKDFNEYYVQPWDTFFDIVNNYMEDNNMNEDRREVAHYIEEYNSVDSYSYLQIWQTIKLPIPEKLNSN